MFSQDRSSLMQLFVADAIYCSEADFLSPGESDHSPVVVTVQDGRRIKSSFKYFHFWFSQPDFLDVVRAAWDMQVYGCAMFKLYKRLENVKAKLKEFSRFHYSGISKRTQMARMEMEAAQKSLHDHPHDEDLAEAERIWTHAFSDLRLKMEGFYLLNQSCIHF